ncbi:MAG: hypothetical protein A2836_02915 [Candidatus Taylorbacteria bacterium RIFCSPHIGHO2_01_FULL_45_63]|uniref:Uncharacterized protein n=1 Tax=Candidatus Taylorbacteria bacterium RIFCSPHIGHO2_02_FULL_45_35 TaxID=1802311 RepID=A0A1G2MQT8_9BACT|nr:MAG: hypothetical protein A2836_02915 [Candidatus Taylorbacteria bacterium RIFCSPHIGHO2_01_FULL_45_63]OHA26223.1 MAG: hypothetical protein A3D56_03590 [Candidatus Taylorbacteria bacterium RIFCSPHIGHO2_02_FULL_45_35]OHA32563.1 MAG: hypothetical protein A3A22_04080 [Candidatus Taylorbacteria bacterium RIFCSPLOWO2_01_FULL_45_34b]
MTTFFAIITFLIYLATVFYAGYFTGVLVKENALRDTKKLTLASIVWAISIIAYFFLQSLFTPLIALSVSFFVSFVILGVGALLGVFVAIFIDKHLFNEAVAVVLEGAEIVSEMFNGEK